VKDLILIPTFARPEYLTLCLEHIAKADKGNVPKEIWVSHDRHTVEYFSNANGERELTKRVVVEEQLRGTNIAWIEKQPHPYIGNPCNFLELYKAAYNEPDVRYVYLIEDDVLVAEDFFKWHEAVQARGDYFITVGWHCVRRDEPIKNDDPTAYIETALDYSSIGICWKREKLAALVKHARPEYYRSMAVYLGQAFPGSPIPAGQWTEQAGVVTRLLHETRDRFIAWPTLRRCSHVGVSGYHRPNGHRFAHPILAERVKQLRVAVGDDRIIGMNRDFGGDIERVLPAQPWTPEQLHVVQRIPYRQGVI
jgi:hypothetical protein